MKIAWDGYRSARKSPITRKAGPEFADPNYELSVDWLTTRDAIREAQARHDDAAGRSHVLLVCGAARNDKTCPGEMSKSYRMVEMAKLVFESLEAEVDVLDLSVLTSEYGKSFIRAKGVYRPRCRCVIGRVHATRITAWDR